jgi:hypothetical protein
MTLFFGFQSPIILEYQTEFIRGKMRFEESKNHIQIKKNKPWHDKMGLSN